MANETNQELIFLKIDFKKAYDKVDHQFLWEMLQAMAFDPHIITLLKGLVTNVSSKVHVNRMFTVSFEIQRGVCRGDPIAPLLFVLLTQPLMSMLNQKRREGELVGLKINQEKSLMYQHFADDTGLFPKSTREEFEIAHAVVQAFEAHLRTSLVLSLMSRSLSLSLLVIGGPGIVH